MLKQRFGMSIQALLYRMKDLNIITGSYYKRWCIEINSLGWKKIEPGHIVSERPQWLRRTALRAFAEGLLTVEETEKIIGESIRTKESSTLIERRSFMKLSIEERRKIMAKQAEQLLTYYKESSELADIQGGDIIEY